MGCDVTSSAPIGLSTAAPLLSGTLTLPQTSKLQSALFRNINSEALLTSDSRLINWIQPLEDPRWAQFLARHPHSSIFHTPEWLEALRRTFGYEPIAITTSPSAVNLTNAAVFCGVESWLTGRRLVSLPFSDHCDVLTDNVTNLATIAPALKEQLHRQNLRYIEIRPRNASSTSILEPSSYPYCLHLIDLRPSLDTLFRNCHKNSTQRKIRRAEREGLTYREGRSDFLLNSFYYLMLLTRRRQMALPQPRRWFQSLIKGFGEALKIRVAFTDKQPIAAILTLRYKDTLVYKYGCSDAEYHRMGGVHLLFWKSIQEAKRDGLAVFDLGRSEWAHTGLIAFKDRWGASRSTLTYLRIVNAGNSNGAFAPIGTDWKGRTARSLLGHLPQRVVQAAGNLMSRHTG